MTKQDITYKAAVEEIEEIITKIEEGETDVDALTSDVKRVTELLKICRKKLHLTENEVNKILENNKQS